MLLEQLFSITGKPFRVIGLVNPLAWGLLKRAALFRHQVYCELLYPNNDKAKVRHINYVNAFYDGKVK